MASLRIVPIHASSEALSAAKGRLFEGLVSDLLRAQGYRISATPRVNYAGMEIDIEGTHTLSGSPFIAECKGHATPISSPDVQCFLAKLWMKWEEDHRCHGIFVAVPGISSEAQGLVNEAKSKLKGVSLIILQQEDIISALEETRAVPPATQVRSHSMIPADAVAGDSVLVATEQGCYWIQLLLERGHTTPSMAFAVDGNGSPVPDGNLLRAIADRTPELGGVTLLSGPHPDSAGIPSLPEAAVVEVDTVKGSSSWFEYQFPASPGFFVGREAVVADVSRLLDEIEAGSTTSRGILLQAYSGWGKSSLVLKLHEALRPRGCLVAAIDCRAASTAYFPLRAMAHALSSAAEDGFIGLEKSRLLIGGMSSLRDVLAAVSEDLGANGRWLCVAFDQFEGVFGSPAILESAARLASIVTDLGGRILLCFAWKTDLVGLTQEFPYRTRDEISGKCRVFTLDRFGEKETAAVLDALERELHTKLRKDLAFLLRESSQGYPWLLKKLCAHVLTQRQAGVTQIQLATQMLRVKQLFDEDLAGLSLAEEQALRHIARVAPVAFADVTDVVPVDVLDSLIHKRLVIRVANKYDIYWDIFKDYLNTEAVPVEESFILRSPVGSVLAALEKIRASGAGEASLAPAAIGLASQGTFYNVVRDLQLLGLVVVHPDRLSVTVDLPAGEPLDVCLARPLQEKMRRHRIVRRLLSQLEESEPLPFTDLARVTQEMCPYITADQRTWATYARILASWLVIAQLITVDRKRQEIRRFNPETDIRTGRPLWSGPRARKGPFLPEVRYARIEAALLDLSDAIKAGGQSWTPKRLTARAWWQSFRLAIELGFTEYVGNRKIRLTPIGSAFVSTPEQRPRIFHAQACSRVPAYSAFVDIIQDDSAASLSLAQVGSMLGERLGVSWTSGTAEWVAKTLNNWAKAAGQVGPGRRRRKGKSDQGQLALTVPEDRLLR